MLVVDLCCLDKHQKFTTLWKLTERPNDLLPHLSQSDRCFYMINPELCACTTHNSILSTPKHGALRPGGLDIIHGRRCKNTGNVCAHHSHVDIFNSIAPSAQCATNCRCVRRQYSETMVLPTLTQTPQQLISQLEHSDESIEVLTLVASFLRRCSGLTHS